MKDGKISTWNVVPCVSSSLGVGTVKVKASLFSQRELTHSFVCLFVSLVGRIALGCNIERPAAEQRADFLGEMLATTLYACGARMRMF